MLTHSAKIDIVNNNIFGLDLAPNAVNECHKNIFNHILEDPKDEEIERLEVVLKKNIKVGNALDVQIDLFLRQINFVGKVKQVALVRF